MSSSLAQHPVDASRAPRHTDGHRPAGKRRRRDDSSEANSFVGYMSDHAGDDPPTPPRPEDGDCSTSDECAESHFRPESEPGLTVGEDVSFAQAICSTSDDLRTESPVPRPMADVTGLEVAAATDRGSSADTVTPQVNGSTGPGRPTAWASATHARQSAARDVATAATPGQPSDLRPAPPPEQLPASSGALPASARGTSPAEELQVPSGPFSAGDSLDGVARAHGFEVRVHTDMPGPPELATGAHQDRAIYDAQMRRPIDAGDSTSFRARLRRARLDGHSRGILAGKHGEVQSRGGKSPLAGRTGYHGGSNGRRGWTMSGETPDGQLVGTLHSRKPVAGDASLPEAQQATRLVAAEVASAVRAELSARGPRRVRSNRVAHLRLLNGDFGEITVELNTDARRLAVTVTVADAELADRLSSARDEIRRELQELGFTQVDLEFSCTDSDSGPALAVGNSDADNVRLPPAERTATG